MVPRAYSADLLSPVHNHIPEHPLASSHGPQHPLMFGAEESAHATHLQGYPPLQPTSHLSNQPTTSPDTMVYAAQETNHAYLKSEASPTFVKSEGADPGYQVSGFQGNAAPLHTASEPPYTHSGITRPEDNYARQSVVGYQAPPPQYSFLHGYTAADGLNAEQMDRFQLAQQGSGLEVVMPNQKPPITKRGPFRNQEKRKQTAHVRKIGSCIRCRMQRIRVSEIAQMLARRASGMLTIDDSARPTLTPPTTMMPRVMGAERSAPTPRSTVFHVNVGRSPKSSSSSQAKSKDSSGQGVGRTPRWRLTSASGTLPT